jgi:hypothetical protein
VIFLSETKSLHSLVSPILNLLGFYLMTHVAPIGSCGGLILAWRAGVELESFITNKHNITSWCLSDPPSPHGFFLAYMALLKRKTKLLFGTLSLLLVRILTVPGYPLEISILCWTNMKNLEAILLLAPPTVHSEIALITMA